MKLFEIAESLEAAILCGEDLLERNFDTAGASDLMSDILAGMADQCIFLTGLATVQVVRTALIANVGGVVFVRNKKPSEDVVEMAREEALPLLSTPFSMFVSCGRLHARGLTGLTGVR